MYLRRNNVRCGDSRRAYLSIAHNVWCAREGARKSQSRPVIIASFGAEDKIDVDIAQDIVSAVENCSPQFRIRRGEGREATTRLAEHVRKIEAFLRVLASRKLGLAKHFGPGPRRVEALEALIRDRLAEPPPRMRDDELLHSIKASMGA